jgi:peptidoglycan/xylan/chitin deacetylase (PgdA/CDA1 family)
MTVQFFWFLILAETESAATSRRQAKRIAKVLRLQKALPHGDDGPTLYTTRAIIGLLARYNAKATFFVTGERASANPVLIEMLVQAGHDVFGHGWDHARYKTSNDLVAQIDRAEALLRQYRPTPSPYLVRLPYADGRRVQSLHRTIRRWNSTAQIAHWTYWLEDWNIPSLCTDRGDLERVSRPDLINYWSCRRSMGRYSCSTNHAMMSIHR